MKNDERRKQIEEAARNLHIASAFKLEGPLGRLEVWRVACEWADANPPTTEVLPTTEISSSAEKFAKKMIHDRGVPHWHDLRDCYLAGYARGKADANPPKSLDAEEAAEKYVTRPYPAIVFPSDMRRWERAAFLAGDANGYARAKAESV